MLTDNISAKFDRNAKSLRVEPPCGGEGNPYREGIGGADPRA